MPFLLLPVPGAHPAAAVPGVEVVHQPLEADDQIVVLIEGVDVFRGGEHSDFVFPQIVDEQGGLGAVAAQAGQILHHHGLDLSRLHHLVDPIDAGAVEVHPAHIVVERLAHHLMAISDGVVKNDLPLVAQGVEFLVLVSGQAVIQPDFHAPSFPMCCAFFCSTTHTTIIQE